MTSDSLRTALDHVETLLRAAATAQQVTANPNHEQFYLWAGALDEITHRLDGVVHTLSRQLRDYPSRLSLYDDEGDDPTVRISAAAEALRDLAGSLSTANASARLAHSAIGHIGAHLDDDSPVDAP